MSCIVITVGWGLSLQSLLRRRRLRSGEVLRLGKLEKMKSHISNIDDDQEVGGGGGGGGGTYVQSIKWGCPSCAVPEFEKFPVPQFMWSGPSCTQSWMHDLQPRARGWELELGIFQRKPRPKVMSRDPPLPQSNYEKNWGPRGETDAKMLLATPRGNGFGERRGAGIQRPHHGGLSRQWLLAMGIFITKVHYSDVESQPHNTTRQGLHQATIPFICKSPLPGWP